MSVISLFLLDEGKQKLLFKSLPNTGHEELNFTYNYLALKVAPSLILEHLAVTNFPS